MLVSKCCKSYPIVEGNTIHYYVCMQCGRASDLIEQKIGGTDADSRRTKISQEVANP
jgi:hypothetical protein